MARPCGLRLKSGHAALLVVHLEQPNLTPRALPGLISGSNAAIIQALTGPGYVKGQPVSPDTKNAVTA